MPGLVLLYSSASSLSRKERIESVSWTTFSAVFMLLHASSLVLQLHYREQVFFSYDIRFITVETKGGKLFLIYYQITM
jgi:hypothetical protein